MGGPPWSVLMFLFSHGPGEHGTQRLVQSGPVLSPQGASRKATTQQQSRVYETYSDYL